MHRVQVTELTDVMTLGPQATHHLQVLRLQLGERVQVFDGRGRHGEAILLDIADEGRATLELQPDTVGTVRGAETPRPVTLAIALLKGDKLADVVRAATELGAANIQLLITQHAEVRDIGAQKLIRLRRIASEAARQSERSVTPDVLEPLKLGAYKWEGKLLVAHPGSTAKITEVLNWDTPLTVLSGPEGGLSDSEMQDLLARGAQPVTLGPRILRAETAPIAMLGAIAATGR